MAEKFQRTTAESTRFRVDGDCYGHAGEGYLVKGSFITVPKGTPVSMVWTEVDENGDEVKDGFKSRKVSRHIERPAGSEDRSIVELSEEGTEEAGDEEPAPTAKSPAKAARKR